MTSHSSGSVRLATRGSPLAVAQAQHVAALLAAAHEGLEVELILVETGGDRNKTDPLREIGGQGIFAKEVQVAVLRGDADVAVHSAKDLPSITPDGLELVSTPERLDPADVLVGRSLDGLGPGATVATGSPRRQALLRSIRPDLEIVELRGNMKTRLATAGSNGVDAVITAAAALIRLAETKLIADRLDPSVFTPQVAQGALALECRVGDPLSDLLRAVDNHDVHRCLDAERSFQETLGVGCTVPAGAWCIIDDDALWLRAAMLDESMSAIERHERRGTDPIELGREVARSFTATGRNI